MMKKIKEWLRRYAVAELISITTVVITANISYQLTGNTILSAFIATWAENVAFYGFVILRELRERKHLHGEKLILRWWSTLKNTFFEYGPAEYLDSFIMRPFYLSFFPSIIENYSMAIFLGSIAANLSFYIPAIVSYELRKKRQKS
jgi:hypothetical protein